MMNTEQQTTIVLRSKGAMSRKPRTISPQSGIIRINFLVDAALVHKVDAEAKRMAAEDPYKRATSRTDALRTLIEDGLKFRAERRGK